MIPVQAQLIFAVVMFLLKYIAVAVIIMVLYERYAPTTIRRWFAGSSESFRPAHSASPAELRGASADAKTATAGHARRDTVTIPAGADEGVRKRVIAEIPA